MTAVTEADVDELCFTARALAQSHPMTEASNRYRQECFERERQRQPVTELADWAGTALLVGYCLRRSEERRVPESRLAAVPAAAADCGDQSEPADKQAPEADRQTPATDEQAPEADEPAGIDEEALAELSRVLRAGDAGRVTLAPAEVTVAALDRIIATELDKRREHLREQMDEAAWSELEDYIAWWVIHGYALRAGERPKR